MGPGTGSRARPCRPDDVLHYDLSRAHAPEVQANLTVYDRSVALHHTGDDTEILETILRMFVDQGPERMGLVEAALALRDARSLEREAHALKGAAATLGLEDLRQAAYAVERLGADGRLDEAVAGVAAMRLAMDAALAALGEELA